MSTLRQLIGRYDYFWVFVPRYDSWRLCRLAGVGQHPVIADGGMWVILATDKVEDFEAIGIEMPRHPRSVTVPKTPEYKECSICGERHGPHGGICG